MNRDFENLNQDNIEVDEKDKLESVEVEKEIITPEGEVTPDYNNDLPKEKVVFKESSRKTKGTYNSEYYKKEDPIYYENEFGRDVYPLELYAGFFRRFFAFILDSIIGGALASILLDGILVFTGLDIAINIYDLLRILLVMAYFTISTYVTNGQSLGKMILGLKVVSLDGKDLTLPQVVTREFFGRFIHTYGLLWILYILTALTERKQNLSDLFADTSVLDLAKERAYKVGQIDTEGKTVIC